MILLGFQESEPARKMDLTDSTGQKEDSAGALSIACVHIKPDEAPVEPVQHEFYFQAGSRANRHEALCHHCVPFCRCRLQPILSCQDASLYEFFTYDVNFDQSFEQVEAQTYEHHATQ